MHARLSLPSRDIVLLGVGHTNAHVLRMWRMQPIPDVRLTCVSNFHVVTYSGMLPGVLAGQYPPERMEIDLVRLCAAAGARLIVDEVSGLDISNRRLLFADRSPIPFDVLSIGIGSVPQFGGVQVDGDSVLTIKPMQTFLARLTERLERCKQSRLAASRQGSVPASSNPLHLCIVGGGAGGVEAAFCIPHHVRRMLPDVPVQIHLIHSGESLVPGALPRTSRLVQQQLQSRHVELHLQRSVTSVSASGVTLDDGRRVPAEIVIWATSAAPPPLLSQLDLPKDGRGFLLTRPTLQTTADAPIFIVGDTGTRAENPTAKAGVYAVRQGPVLWENIRHTLAGRPLVPYEPQSNFLKLLNTGDGRAIGEYKGVALHTVWLWRLKDWIDGRFMDKYQDYRPMSVPDTPSVRDAEPRTMKCAGCGGKLGMQALGNALRRLDIPTNEHVILGLDRPDDAAVLRLKCGPTIVTTDFFTAPLDDPYLVGRIAALNAASDAFAMGARPVAALAMATIPDGPAPQQEELLYQLLSGSLREFAPMQAALVGGHTIEGSQLTIGFTILAEPWSDSLCTKSSLQVGDELILTKPLGAGVLLAAHMRTACPASAMPPLLAAMLTSNEPAARLAVDHGVRAITDVTGFGLAGHLLEMLRASNVAAELELSAIPLLPGVSDPLASGLESTLAPSNRRSESEIATSDEARNTPNYTALFDPQTSGGLLIGVRSERSAALVAQLQRQPGGGAVTIGRVVRHDGGQARLRLV